MEWPHWILWQLRLGNTTKHLACQGLRLNSHISKVDIRLWNIADFFLGMNISQVKLKVLERSTGHKKVEEWTFLPKDWIYDLIGNYLVGTMIWGQRPIIFEKNFALLIFDTWPNLSRDDIMILNLVTRKSFWMRSWTVKTQIKEKAAGQIDLGDLWIDRFRVYGMIVENDRLLIQYEIRMRGEIQAVTLGWFSIPKIWISPDSGVLIRQIPSYSKILKRRKFVPQIPRM